MKEWRGVGRASENQSGVKCIKLFSNAGLFCYQKVII